MSQYCSTDDVSNLLPQTIVIGTSLLDQNVNALEETVTFWINQTAGIIDSYLTSFYRVPLMKYKEPVDFSTDPVTFTEIYPHPIIMINARLASASLYDSVISANQEPNIAEWGMNQRSLAYDDLILIQSGMIQLKNQVRTGMRFVRQELFDPSRSPTKSEIQAHSRQAGK